MEFAACQVPPTDAEFFAAPLAPIVRSLERAVVGATMPADAILNTKKRGNVTRRCPHPKQSHLIQRGRELSEKGGSRTNDSIKLRRPES